MKDLIPKHVKIALIIGACGFVGISSLFAQEEQVYLERFNNTTGANTDLSTSTWTGSTDNDVGGFSPPGISGGTGYELNFDDSDLGFVFMYHFNGGNTLFLSNTSIDRDAQELTRVEFGSRGSDIATPQVSHLVVQIGGQWYVSVANYTSEVNQVPHIYELFEIPFSTSASAWRSFDVQNHTGNDRDLATYTIGDVLSSDLPAGDIENFGFYSLAFPGESTVFDDVAVYAIGTGGSTWYDYPIQDLNWVDTMGWLGWVNVTYDPWVWVDALGSYVYLPDDFGWAYIPNF